MTEYFILKGTEIKRYNHQWNFIDGSHLTTDAPSPEKIVTERDVLYKESDIRPRDMKDDQGNRNYHFKLPDKCFPWSYIEVNKDLVVEK